MNVFSEEEIQALIEKFEGEWTEADIRRGYAIFSSDNFAGAKEIQRIDEIAMFDGDEEAAIQAEKDGIKIIRGIFDVDDENFAYYLDTPQNREILERFIHVKK